MKGENIYKKKLNAKILNTGKKDRKSEYMNSLIAQCNITSS
jgi:hypothetical protein